MKSSQNRPPASPLLTVRYAALSSHIAASLVDAEAVAPAAAAAAAGDGNDEEQDVGVPQSLPCPAADRHWARGLPERRTGSPTEPVHHRGRPAATWPPSPVEGTWASRRYGCSHQPLEDWHRRHPTGRLSSPPAWSSVEEELRRWMS